MSSSPVFSGKSSPLHRTMGHIWTLLPWFQTAVSPSVPPYSRLFRLLALDPELETVTLTGRLSQRNGPVARPGANGTGLVVILHGLGGSARSAYAKSAALAAHHSGLDSLRLNLRGADRRGEDFYHGGLSQDVRSVLASPELGGYQDIYLLGYSLGGHVTLKTATETLDPRVRGVCAVCPPMDLSAGSAAIDARERTVYRRHVLRGLKESYAQVFQTLPYRNRAAGVLFRVDPADARRIDSIREWDERIVAPRFGFANAADYYQRSSVGPRLSRLRARTLIVLTEQDPMVPAATVRPHLERMGDLENVEVRWLSAGGHVGFPPAVNILGDTESAEAGFADQLMQWFRATAGRGSGRRDRNGLAP